MTYPEVARAFAIAERSDATRHAGHVARADAARVLLAAIGEGAV